MKPRLLYVVVAAAMVLSACGNQAPSTSSKPLAGQKVEIAAVWSATEEANFKEVLAAFDAQTGATTTFTSTGDKIGQVLVSRLASNSPPDVAVLPQPGLLHDLAAKGSLKELDSATASLISQNYAAVWKDLGTVNGKLYGLFFKGANKSTVWYNAHAFQSAGVASAPKSWDDFKTAISTLSAAGIKPLSVGGADGWTVTDWFENVYLQQAGAAKYDQLTKHQIPWTDDSVKSALRLLAGIFTPPNINGGLAGALQTDFPTSVSNIAGSPPKAAIVYEGDFVEGILTSTAHLTPVTDFNFFPFPTINGAPLSVMGGGDVVVRMTNSQAGAELVKFLASPQAANIWVAKGGFTSPNKNSDLSKYPDPIAKASAQALVSAQVFRFDMSDQAPAAFGSTTGSGEWADLQQWLKAPNDVDAAAAQLEKDATAATGWPT